MGPAQGPQFGGATTTVLVGDPAQSPASKVRPGTGRWQHGRGTTRVGQGRASACSAALIFAWAISPAGISKTDRVASPSPSLPQKKNNISMYRCITPYQYKNIHINSTDPSSVDQKSSKVTVHRPASGPESGAAVRSTPAHGGGGHGFPLLPGVTSGPGGSTGTWRRPWLQSGGQKESQTHACAPPAQRQPSDSPRLAHAGRKRKVCPGRKAHSHPAAGGGPWGLHQPLDTSGRPQTCCLGHSPPRQRCRQPRHPPHLRLS